MAISHQTCGQMQGFLSLFKVNSSWLQSGQRAYFANNVCEAYDI